MLDVKTWNSRKSKKIYKQWLEDGFSPDYDKDWLSVRNDLIALFKKVEIEITKAETKKEYFTDVLFGIELFQYFAPNKNGFSLRTAEDPDFWSYLSIKVIPDIVAKRWDIVEGNENRYFVDNKKTRIWLSQIWWYVYLTFNDNLENTKKILLSEGFTTDTIMHLVDRTGSKGIFIDVYREIINQYYLYDKKLLENSKITYAKLFKNVMKLNTSKILTFEPPLYKGGVKGYVADLFAEATIRK